MLDISQITAGYEKKVVLQGISHQAPRGRIVGIVGMNGAGKSTFFNVLAGVIKPFSGNMTFEGKPLNFRQTGYVETTNYFYSMITGHEYLRIFDQTNTYFNLEALLPYLHLPLDDLIETYSTGMKKKLAILAVVKQDKQVYLFDEPFNGLDMETNKVVELLITALKDRNKIVFVSSHILEPLITVCDEILILEQGIFSRSYQQENFDKIDQELFGKFREKAMEIIRNAI